MTLLTRASLALALLTTAAGCSRPVTARTQNGPDGGADAIAVLPDVLAPDGRSGDTAAPDGGDSGDAATSPADGALGCGAGKWCYENPRPTGESLHAVRAAS